MGFFDDIGKAVVKTANTVANTANQAAKAAQRAAEQAAREAQRAAEQAARAAQRAAEQAAREAQEQLQSLGNVTVKMSEEAKGLADELGNELAQFGGDAKRAMEEGALKPMAEQLVARVRSENSELFAQLEEIRNNLSDLPQVMNELRQLSVDATSGKLDPETAKQQVLKLSKQIGIDKLNV